MCLTLLCGGEIYKQLIYDKVKFVLENSYRVANPSVFIIGKF